MSIKLKGRLLSNVKEVVTFGQNFIGTLKVKIKARKYKGCLVELFVSCLMTAARFCLF